MEEILHHLLFKFIQPYEKWDVLHTNWCRIPSINSTISFLPRGKAASFKDVSWRDRVLFQRCQQPERRESWLCLKNLKINLSSQLDGLNYKMLKSVWVHQLGGQALLHWRSWRCWSFRVAFFLLRLCIRLSWASSQRCVLDSDVNGKLDPAVVTRSFWGPVEWKGDGQRPTPDLDREFF